MKKILRAVGIMLALIAIYVLAQAMVSLVIALINLVPIVMREISTGAQPDIVRMMEEMMRTVGAQTPLILIFSVVITVPFYYLIYRCRKQELLTFLSFRGIGAISIPVLVIFGIAMNFLVEWLLALASEISFLAPFFRSYEQLAAFIIGGDFILSLLAVGILGPIFEEVLFRGLIFGELRKITKVRSALFLQAVLFGAFHMNVIQGSYAFIIGIVLGYVCYRSNSILAPIIVHITINTTSVILSRFVTGDALNDWIVVIIVASVILFAATSTFILISRSFRRTMDNSLYYMNHAPTHEPPAVGE